MKSHLKSFWTCSSIRPSIHRTFAPCRDHSSDTVESITEQVTLDQSKLFACMIDCFGGIDQHGQLLQLSNNERAASYSLKIIIL
jgi:hypothetical protein